MVWAVWDSRWLNRKAYLESHIFGFSQYIWLNDIEMIKCLVIVQLQFGFSESKPGIESPSIDDLLPLLARPGC
jgi:hypothetical protein